MNRSKVVRNEKAQVIRTYAGTQDLRQGVRIQEDCKRLDKEFLISEKLLNRVSGLGNIKASFVEETIPRGREETVRLHSLEYLK